MSSFIATLAFPERKSYKFLAFIFYYPNL